MAATKFHFQLNQSGPHLPGDEVSGRMTLRVSVDRDHVRGLQVCFVARETTFVSYREMNPRVSNNHRRYMIIREQACHDVALIPFPIPHKYNRILRGDVIPAGNYEIPFQFTIPKLPKTGFTNAEIDKESTSNTNTQADRSRASIFCGLWATIHRDPVKSKDIIGKQAMHIIPCPQIPKQVGISEPQVYKMTGLLFHDGDIIMGCKLTNIMLRRGEAPQLHVCLINESKAKVKTMTVQLHQVSKWTAQTKSKLDTTIIWSHVVQVNIPRKKRGAKGDTPKPLLEQHKHHIAKELNESNTESQYSTAYTLPPIPNSTTKAIINTYQGDKIQVTHQLVIQLDQSGFYDNITVTIPVRIVDQDTAATTAPTIPVAQAVPVPAVQVAQQLPEHAPPEKAMRADEVEC